MTATAVFAGQHLRLLTRRRTFVAMLGVLLLMTALSGLIGWSSHRTITQVYDETVRTLQAAGKPAPPNPFAAKPRLSLLNNMIVYVPLIGALLAILIGHLSVMDDRQAGVTRVIFSRPVPRSAYALGKLAGSAIALAIIMAACLGLSVAALTLINGGPPTSSELLRLTLFYVLSGLYLLLFVLVGSVAAFLTSSQSMGLFAAVAIWVLVTFATPQFTSGLRPVASLNPVSDPVTTTSSTFFRTTSKAKPIAVNEQYKALGTRILAEGSRLEPVRTLGQLAPILGFTLLLAAATGALMRRHDFSQEGARDRRPSGAVLTLAGHEYRSAARSRVLLLLILSMVLVAAGSITIAAYDFRAQIADYKSYVEQARAAGAQVIPAPQLFPLQLLRGVIEYVQIIGAVLAIGLGYLSVARERTGRTLPLILTRPVRSRELFLGRVSGAGALIATVLAVTAVTSVVLIGVVGGQWLSATELVRVVITFGTAVVYMLLFYARWAHGLSARSGVLVNGLVAALVVWLCVVLIVPQIGDTMDPDNQVPGGLFTALQVTKPDEKMVLAKFSSYETIRNSLEQTSLTKHFERFTFAATGIKDKYNGVPLGVIVHDKRSDLEWLAVYTVLMGALMWTGLRRQSTIRKDS